MKLLQCILKVSFCSLCFTQTNKAFAEYKSLVRYSSGNSISPENTVFKPQKNVKFGLTGLFCTENLFFCSGFGFAQGSIKSKISDTTTQGDITTVSTSVHTITYRQLHFATELYPFIKARQIGQLFVDPYFLLNANANRYTAKQSDSSSGSSQSSYYTKDMGSVEYGIGFERIFTRKISMQIAFINTDETYVINGSPEKITTQAILGSFGWTPERTLFLKKQ